jgi:hypothetical protein
VDGYISYPTAWTQLLAILRWIKLPGRFVSAVMRDRTATQSPCEIQSRF